MRPLALLAALAVSAPALAGEPVLVPDFTPGTTSEFALAFMLQERVYAALAAKDHLVVPGDAAATVAGPLDACADVEGCPHGAMQKLPVRIAVVVRVAREGDQILAEVEIYERSGPSPVDRRTVEIVSGNEGAFADMVVRLVEATIGDLGPGSNEDLMAAARLVEAAKSAPAAPPPPIVAPEAPPPSTEPPTAPPADDLDELLAAADLGRRHLVGARRNYEESGLTPLEWVYSRTPHAGRITVEVRGGLGLGDVDRTGDVRVFLDGDLAPEDEWLQEGPQSANRVRGELFVGYAPATFFDFGAVIGLQYGERSLTTGYSIAGEPASQSSVDAVQAAQLVVAPRFRFYLAPLGPLKPYAFGSGELRLFDRYKIVDPEEIDYPEPPGGSFWGIGGGGGLLIDPGPIVGFFAEGGYSYHLGVRSAAAERGPRPASAPSAPEGAGRTIALVAGVQFRI